MKRKFLLLVAFALVIISTFTIKIENCAAQWVQSSGPGGAIVQCFAVSGLNLFAGTTRGIYLSADNGASWDAVNNGLSSQGVYALTFSGTNLFAGTGGGVFLSTNFGSSWTAVNSGITYIDIRALAVSGSNIFAGSYSIS